MKNVLPNPHALDIRFSTIYLEPLEYITKNLKAPTKSIANAIKNCFSHTSSLYTPLLFNYKRTQPTISAPAGFSISRQFIPRPTS